MAGVTIFQAITLGVVEGLTEFLPISSTGHMILTSSMLHVPDDDFTKLFEICIQLGAILSVVILYRNRFLRQGVDFYKKLLIAVAPALVLGLLFNKKIDALLESDLTVAYTMLFGGVGRLALTSRSLGRSTARNHREQGEEPGTAHRPSPSRGARASARRARTGSRRRWPCWRPPACHRRRWPRCCRPCSAPC